MKCLTLILLILIQFTIFSSVFSQNVSINNTGAEADTSAMVDITSTSKGLLVPRMTYTERLAIPNPANSLLVYQTDSSRGFYYYSTFSSSWILLASSGGSIVSLNGLTAANQSFATPGTVGTAPQWVSSDSTHTLNIPLALTANVTAGLLSNSDYSIFNNKISAITLNGGLIHTTTAFTVDEFGNATGTLGLSTKTANTFFAGPSIGGNAAPTFRAIANADLPFATATLRGAIIPGDGLSISAGVLSTTGAAPTGAAGGDLSGTYPNPVLAISGVTANTYGNNTGTSYPYITVDAKGRITTALTQAIEYPVTSVNSGTGAVSLGLSNLNDVTIAIPATNQLLQYNGTKWVNATPSYLSSAITSLNTLTSATQTFATGTTGTDFTIGSSGSTHTFNLPDATSSARGVINTGAQTIGGSKTFLSAPIISSLTAGSVPFIGTGGVLSQNNASLFWDATNSRLGIGTNAPAQKLDVNGTIMSSSTSYPNYAYNSANRMAFGESNVPANETGSVVQYGSGSTSRNMLFAFSKTNVNTSFLGNDGTQMMLGTESASPITFRTNLSYAAANIMASGAEAMRITNTGRVGIGTTAPATALHVTATNPLTLIGVAVGTNTTADSLLTITSGLVRKLPLSTFASSVNAWSTAGNNGTASTINFIGTIDNNSLNFKTNNLSRMHLDSLGGLFIGDSASSYTNTVTNTQAGFRSDWTTSLTSADIPRIALQGQMRGNLTSASGSAQIRGFNGSALVGVNSGVTSNADIYGGYFLGRRQTTAGVTEGTGTLSLLAGAGIEYGHTATANAGGTTTNVYGIKLNPLYASGTITNLYGLAISTPATGGTVINMYDIFLASQSLTGVTNSWGIYQENTKNNYFAGNIGIGTSTPATALHVVATNPLTLIGVAVGTNTTTDSLLTITSGLVRKLPLSTFASAANAISSLNGLTATSQTFAVPGTTGTAPAWSSAVSTHTLNIPLASAASVTAGLLSNADFSVFNTKQPQLNGTGFVKASGTTISYDNSTYLTGNQSITFTPTGDVTGSASGTVSLTPALTIAAGVVANTKLANMATQTFKGRTTAGSGAPEDLTGTQATAILNTFGALKGLVPGVVSSTTQFLRADGIFAVPSGTTNGTVTSVSITTANGISGSVATNTTTPAITLTLGAITPASVTAAGAVTGANLSGTNTGDETTATIKTKLGPASGIADGYLTLADWNTFNNKATSSNSWSTTGNAGTTAGTNFIGTADATDFVIKTNSVERMRLVNSTGYLGIGTSAPTGLLSLETITGGGANDNVIITSYNNTGGAPDPAIRIRAATGTPALPGFINAGTELGALIGNTWNGSGLADVAKINFIAEQNLSASAMGTRISFSTASGASNITEKMRLDQNGSLGVGATAFNTTNPERLLVDAGVTGNTSYQNVFVGKGNTNSYAQLNIQNSNGGTAASSDVIATNDAGTEANQTGFVDMGINSSGNTSTGVLGGSSTAYLYSTGNDFAIGNNTSTKSLNFFTTDAVGSAERMRIDGTGKVGIGNAAPSEKLDVTGNIRFSGALMPGNSPGTSGQVLTSAGAGVVPTWSNSGTVTSLSVGTANGLAGTVSASTTAPVVTLSTTVTGIVKGNGTALSAATPGDFPTLNQNTTGNAATVTTNANLTGDVTSSGNATSIPNATITNAKLANMATQTFKGRTTAGTGSPEDLSASQATAILNTFNTVKGLVPGVVSNTTQFLRADGTFTVPAGTGISSLNTLTTASQTFATGVANADFNIVSSGTTHTFNLPDAAATARGLVTTGAQTLAGSKTFSSAPLFSSLTTGSIPFVGASGLISENNTRLFWDATNNNLGVGAAPAGGYRLDLVGTTSGGGSNTILSRLLTTATTDRSIFQVQNNAGNGADFTFRAYGSAYNETLMSNNMAGGALMLSNGPASAPLAIGSFNAANFILGTGNTERMRILGSNGNVGIGITAPTAVLQLEAGTTTAGTAPLKLTQGVNMTTAETGAVEFDGTNYFATSGTIRYTLAKTLTITQTIDFASTTTGNSNSTTVALTGAADGDVVILGVPGGSFSTANTDFTAYVSAAGVITVKFLNNSGATVNPASGTFRISILKY